MSARFRLGRLPASPTRLALAPQFAAHPLATAPVPPRCDRSHIAFTPGLYDNDTLPDCVPTAFANSAAGAAALQGWQLAIVSAKVPAFYAACADCADTDAAMAATDGLVLLDALEYQQAHGFDIGQQAPLVADFNVIPPGNMDALALACARIGPVVLGITLYAGDMDAFSAGQGWAGPPSGAAVGGHCVIAWDYDRTPQAMSKTWRLGTWGQWQTATEDWLAARLDEAHAVAWRQIMAAASYADAVAAQ